MKKIIAMLLMGVLLFSNVVVFAVDTPTLDFLKHSTSNNNVEQNGTLSIKLNESFGLLEILANESASNVVDLVSLVESLFDTTLNINSKIKMSGDGKNQSMETHIKSNIPFKANDNLEGNIKTNYSVWAEIDFSDEDNPYFDVIMTLPFAAKYKYITVDSDLLAENGAVTEQERLEVYKTLFGSQKLTKLNDEAIDSIKRNAYVTGNSKKVRIAFTDIGLKMYLMDVVVSALSEIDVSMLEGFDADVVKDAMAQVPVFGNEALVMEYTLDSKGRISEDKTVLNVDLNIYDLMLALGEEEPPEETGITIEKCVINFTVTAQTNYKYGSVDIKKPVLTDENSVDIFEYGDPYYYDEPSEDWYYDEDEDYYFAWASATFDNNCIENGKVKYVGLRSFLEEMGYYVYYDNGCIRAEINCDGPKYKAYCFNIGADVVYTDIHDVQMIEPLFLKDGTTYISVEDCENLTNQKKSSITYFYDEGYGYINFWDEAWDLEY